jgi:DNA-binding SARP family transcriptional activator
MTANGASQAWERPVIRLFGPLSIELGGRRLGPGDLGGARPKQVLEILLAARGHRVPTERLAELLWGGQLPQNAAGSLQTFVSVLRRHLVPDRARSRRLVITEPEAYRFATDLVDLDLDRFDALIEAAAHEPTRLARRSLDAALGLVRGELLEDEPYAGWSQDLRSTYRSRVLGARVEAADAALAELDYAAALAHGEAAAALDPFSERAYRSQMLALYALGRQHEALDGYRRFRARLDDELGLEPTAETRGLEAAILRQEDVRALLPRPITCRQDPAAGRSVRLLGRSAELGALDRAAREALDGSARLLLVEGETGLGKTRLLDELATSLIGVPVGRAGASELEQHLPYVPLAAALRDALPALADVGTRLPALQRILPELALHGAGAAPSEVDALEALVELVAGHAPLALLIDDLQWADPATIAALGYLQRRCTGVPLALVATLGTEHAPAEHPARRLRADASLHLQPLTAADLAPLGVPDLHASTEGNPRFVAQAMAADDGGGLHTALAETLLAQCRAEGAWGYRVLLAASALKQPFDPEPLATVLDVDVNGLVEELERLCERRLLRVEGPRFRFRYRLVRDVLLASLSPARRRLVCERLGAPEPGASATNIQAVGSRGA